MKKITTLILFTFLLFQNFKSTAQIDTSFWFAAPWVTPDHWWRDNIKLHISTFNTPSTTVRLRQPGAIAPNKYDTTIVIGPNTTFDYVFWRDKLAGPTNRGFDSLETRPADVVVPYGLYISSSAEITVVYDIVTRAPNFLNPETFSLKGQNALGAEFLCPFQTKWVNQTFLGTACGSVGADLNCDGTVTQPKQQINIVASKANTIIYITPSCNIIGHLANVTYSVLLPNPGSAYTIENASQTTTVIAQNLAGTAISANNPIAVTVTDDSVRGLSGCYDLMGDQIVPVDVVGTDYIMNQGHMNPAEPDGAFILGTVNSTSVTIDDGAVITTTLINKGQTYHYHTTQALTYITASSPVYVLHATGVGNGCELGEALLPPLSCGGSSLVAFSRNTNQNFFLNIICKNGSQSTFTLNNNNTIITSANFTVVPGTSGQYYGAQFNLNTTTLPIGSYTIGNNTDVFAVGVLDGGSSTGGLYHYLSSFLRPTSVYANNSVSISPLCISSNNTISLNGYVSGAAATGIWATNGTGTFAPYTSTLINVSTIYNLSNADTLLSSIEFYLTSIGSCVPVKDSISVPIIQRPHISVGSNTSICNNSSSAIMLTGTVVNALGANWSGGTGFFAPGPNINYLLTPADYSAGTLTLSLTSFGGCSTEMNSITVTILPSPTINVSSSTTLVCIGQTATITANGANTYTWNTASTNTSIAVSPVTNTSYTVNGTSAAGCVGSAMFVQNTSPSPTININSNSVLICIGQSATLTASGANTYTWNTASTNTSITVSPTVNTTYTVNGTAISSCTNSAMLTLNVSTCTGIDNNSIEKEILIVFPNPNTGEFTIKAEGDAKLLLVNELGQQIKTIVLNGNNERKFSVTGLANGIYFVTGKINGQTINKKIVVMK